MENIFKVGDFVRIKEGTEVSTDGDFDKAPHEWFLYETPRVVAINYINNTVGVEFSVPARFLHSCSGQGRPGHCYWLHQSVLEFCNTFDDEISESDEEISILF